MIIAPITIYTSSSCQACDLVKAFFTGHRLPYEERNVEIHEECLAELVEKSGQRIVPVVEIENQIISGLDIKKMEQLIQKPA